MRLLRGLPSFFVPLLLLLLQLGGPQQQHGAAHAAPAPPHAFPWLWSSIPGLSPGCNEGTYRRTVGPHPGPAPAHLTLISPHNTPISAGGHRGAAGGGQLQGDHHQLQGQGEPRIGVCDRPFFVPQHSADSSSNIPHQPRSPPATSSRRSWPWARAFGRCRWTR